MKRIFSFLVVTIITLALLTSCASAPDKPQTSAVTGVDKVASAPSIMELLDDEMIAIYESRAAKLPAAVIYVFQGNGERVESPLYGDDDVNAVLDAIAQITIADQTNLAVTDSDSSYSFINPDGTEAGSVSFNGQFLVSGDQRYEIKSKEALAAIDFPAKTDRDMLTLDGPDPNMHAFLERCKTEAPASIKVVRDASEYEITESNVIPEAVDALYAIGLTRYALQGAEPPTSTLSATFVMNDGWKYSLTFHDELIYIYEYIEPLGVWSFYTDGAEYFIEALNKAE